jgi:hypothetical protein
VLVEHLVDRARADHVQTLRFWVLPVNVGMKHLLHDLGARFVRSDGPTQCYELDVSE